MKKRILLSALLLTNLFITDYAMAKGVSSRGSSSSSISRSSSVARSSTMNAARSSMSRMNTSSRMNNASRLGNRTQTLGRSLVKPGYKRNDRNYYHNNMVYQNNWLMYYLLFHSNNSNIRHRNHYIRDLKDRLNNLSNRPIYTITVEKDGEDRLYVVTPEVYKKISKGDKVKIINNIVEVE